MPTCRPPPCVACPCLPACPPANQPAPACPCLPLPAPACPCQPRLPTCLTLPPACRPFLSLPACPCLPPPAPPAPPACATFYKHDVNKYNRPVPGLALVSAPSAWLARLAWGVFACLATRCPFALPARPRGPTPAPARRSPARLPLARAARLLVVPAARRVPALTAERPALLALLVSPCQSALHGGLLLRLLRCVQLARLLHGGLVLSNPAPRLYTWTLSTLLFQKLSRLKMCLKFGSRTCQNISAKIIANRNSLPAPPLSPTLRLSCPPLPPRPPSRPPLWRSAASLCGELCAPLRTATVSWFG